MEEIKSIKDIENKELKSEKIDIKANWLKVDETCPHCGQVTKRQKGITKQNMKRLFSFNIKKDWLNTLIVIGAIFLIYNAMTQIKSCNDILSNPVDFCADAMSHQYITETNSSNSALTIGNHNSNGAEIMDNKNSSSVTWMR